MKPECYISHPLIVLMIAGTEIKTMMYLITVKGNVQKAEGKKSE